MMTIGMMKMTSEEKTILVEMTPREYTIFQREKTLADRMQEGSLAESEIETIFIEEFGFEDWDRMWTDPYDNSLELSKVPVDHRIPLNKFKEAKDLGFSIIWLNHVDGYETMYTFWRDKDDTNWENHYPMGPAKKKRLGLT